MRAFVAVTDPDWFESLRARPHLDEVNLWHPSAARRLRALDPGEPLLFKLRGTEGRILGGGFFTHATAVPLPVAWEAFGPACGAASMIEMRRQAHRRSSLEAAVRDAHDTVSCTVLHSPFFLDEEEAIPLPADWSPATSYGKVYDLDADPGRSLWRQLCEHLRPSAPLALLEPQPSIFGEPVLVHRRLGCGGFSLVLLDVYGRRCTVTGETTLAALVPTPIRPIEEGGSYRVDNGLLLRADVARLFRQGYLTVTAEGRVSVSPLLAGGEDAAPAYRELDGTEITVPEDPAYRPAGRFLAWHARHVFRDHEQPRSESSNPA